jgi:hypothetical protein
LIITVIAKVTETSLRLVQTTISRNPHSDKKVDWEVRMYQVIDPTASALYFLLLFFYMREIVRRERMSISGVSDYFKPPHLKHPDLTIPATAANANTVKPLIGSHEM